MAHIAQYLDLGHAIPLELPAKWRWSMPKKPPDAKGRFLNILLDMAKLRIGAGRISPKEYIDFKLYRPRYSSRAKQEFVGIDKAREIWFRANYRLDLYALANNKIASAMWFAAHGLPILPTVAIFHDAVGRSGLHTLQSESELRAFLRNEKNYPLFGKPIQGSRSLGAISLNNYVPSHDGIVTTVGQWVSIDDVVSFIRAYADSGYQFQRRVSPHPVIGEVCGNRLATVRLLTVCRHGKPEVMRACWKIPAGAQAADNFWRFGNLLAQLELNSGRVIRVIRMRGADHEEVSRHPDTDMPLLGMTLPSWSEIVRLAVDGAKLLSELPLVGWDIGVAETGPVLVEANVTPDFRLHQLVDQRGIVDTPFSAFIRDRMNDRREYLAAGRPMSFWRRMH